MSLVTWLVFFIFLIYSFVSHASLINKNYFPEGVQAKLISDSMILNGIDTRIYSVKTQSSEVDLIESMKKFWENKKNNNKPPFLLKETDQLMILSRYDGDILYTLQCQKKKDQGEKNIREGIFSVAKMNKIQKKDVRFNDLSFISSRIISESITHDPLKSAKVFSFLNQENKMTFTDSLLRKLYNNGWDLKTQVGNESFYTVNAVKLNHQLSIFFSDHLNGVIGVVVYEVYEGSKLN